MNTPTNHPVSQAEASEALLELSATHGHKLVEQYDTIRRYIAQAGAPEGQAVAMRYRLKFESGVASVNDVDYGDFDSFAKAQRAGQALLAIDANDRPEWRGFAIEFIHPIPRAEAAGVQACGSIAGGRALPARVPDVLTDEQVDAALFSQGADVDGINPCNDRGELYMLIDLMHMGSPELLASARSAYRAAHAAMLATSPAPPDEGGGWRDVVRAVATEIDVWPQTVDVHTLSDWAHRLSSVLDGGS